MYKCSSNHRPKKRRMNPVRPKRELVLVPTPPIFENIRVYIHPYNINGSRRKVLHNLIRKNGGSYTFIADNETTHVLVDEGISSGKLCRSLGWTTFPPNISVLMVGWLSASVRANRCLNSADYEIPCTHRPTFSATYPDVTSESTAATVAADNDCLLSDVASSSVLSEDADVEMLNFDYVYEEGSTYDDGKYDSETSCDDEWLCEPPPTSSSVCYVVEPCNQNPCPTLPTSSSVPMPNPVSLEPELRCKIPKLEPLVNPPPTRPNTLAARLSRVRVRRAPGGQSLIVDLNKETFPQQSTQNVADAKTTLQSTQNITDAKTTNNQDYNGVLNQAVAISTDETPKISKTRNLQNEQDCTMRKAETELSKHPEITDLSDNSASTISKSVLAAYFRKQGKCNVSHTGVSEDKMKTSVTVFSPDEQFDLESVNEVSQVVTMIVESVFEVSVNERIINESVVEISKNAMENDDSVDKTFKNEKILTELVSDVLLRVVEDVVKQEADSEIKVENLNENLSEMYKFHDPVKMLKNASVNEININALQSETDMVHVEKLSKNEPAEKGSWDKTHAECLGMESADTEVIVSESSQLPIVHSIIPPYPVRLFCSGMLPGFEYFIGNHTKYEPECITAEINSPDASIDSSSKEKYLHHNRENLECTFNNDSNAPLSSHNKTVESELVSQMHSCARPDISGPNIFFPFPISASATSSSFESHNSNNPRSESQLFATCHSPNYGIIRKLQLLFESFKKTGDKWRIDVYGKAIFSLAKYPRAVESLEEIQFLPGMSKKIAQKIWQIAQTGYLKEIDEICVRRSEEIRKLFSRAWGISPRIARILYTEGFSDLNDLWTNSNLSRSHLVGLRYYTDLKTKMSKKEATHIFLTVLEVIFEKYPYVQCDACSSLRRNKKTCGHVSILVTLPKGCEKNDHRVLPDIVAKLHQIGYLVDDLIRHEENGHQTKYVGIFKLGTAFKHRRIDITVCTRLEHACAILFLTGSSYFNRAVQQWAVKREMVLDEHSLRIRILNAEGGTAAVTTLYTPDERTIFNYLQLPYRTPEQRDRFIM